jgi:hypothetical protein
MKHSLLRGTGLIFQAGAGLQVIDGWRAAAQKTSQFVGAIKEIFTGGAHQQAAKFSAPRLAFMVSHQLFGGKAAFRQLLPGGGNDSASDFTMKSMKSRPPYSSGLT